MSTDRVNQSPCEAGSTARRGAGSGRAALVGRRLTLEWLARGGAALAALAAALVDDRPLRAATVTGACGAVDTILTGKIRRVVTGADAKGRSRVVSDAIVEASADIWTTSAEQTLGPGPADQPAYARTQQTRYGVQVVGPSRDPKPTRENRQGYHTSGGVAHIFVLDGEITYLTDLDEVALKPGDLVIQRHTSHSWRNDGTKPVRILVAVMQ